MILLTLQIRNCTVHCESMPIATMHWNVHDANATWERTVSIEQSIIMNTHKKNRNALAQASSIIIIELAKLHLCPFYEFPLTSFEQIHLDDWLHMQFQQTNIQFPMFNGRYLLHRLTIKSPLFGLAFVELANLEYSLNCWLYGVNRANSMIIAFYLCDAYNSIKNSIEMLFHELDEIWGSRRRSCKQKLRNR